MNFLQSKLHLFFSFLDIRFYNYLRSKAPSYFEEKDRKVIENFAPDMVFLLNEMDHFYKKVSPFNVSIIERNDKKILDDTTLTYGEISWETIIKIAKELQVGKNDVFYDLGSGSGKFVFAMNHIFGIRSVGIDLIENFIRISGLIAKKLELNKVRFYNQDILKTDFSDATIIYLTATCFNQDFLNRLITRFKKLKNGTRIIIVSRPLQAEHLKLYQVERGKFTWAKDTLYFYEKV